MSEFLQRSVTAILLYSGSAISGGLNWRQVWGSVREGVVQIGVAFKASRKWMNNLSVYKKLASITVGYPDMKATNTVDRQMLY